MATQPPDWHLFRAFLAVMREGSLSSAARAQNTTQPTMGRQIAALEAALGTKLFTRSQDGLSPTEAGLRLLPSAEAMQAAAESALRSASGEADSERGTIRITASEMIGAEILPAILADFQTLHPQISVELALSNRNEDLLRGDADIAIRMLRPTQTALIAKRIGRIDVGFYAHARYLKTHKMPRSFQELQHHALIGYDRDPAAARVIAQMGAPFTRDMFAFRTDSDLAQLAALRAGLGIGACQLGIARRDKNLVSLFHEKWLFSMESWVVMHPDQRGNRRIRLTFDHLAAELTRYAQSSRHEA